MQLGQFAPMGVHITFTFDKNSHVARFPALPVWKLAPPSDSVEQDVEIDFRDRQVDLSLFYVLRG